MVTRTARHFDSRLWARAVNALLGIWLLVSAFAWPHSSAEITNTWITGMLIVLSAAVVSISAPSARFLNTSVAVWLFVSAFVLPRVSAATVWNNAIVAALVFFFSLVPAPPSDEDVRGPRATR